MVAAVCVRICNVGQFLRVAAEELILVLTDAITSPSPGD